MEIHGQIDKIEIIRSAKRSKTIGARLKDNILSIYAPENIPEAKLQSIIEKLKRRILNKQLRKTLNKGLSLKEIADRLNSRYFGGKLKYNSIEYTTNQTRKFGCCNYKEGRILLSHRLASIPDWVRDFVIVHELAHFVVPNHSKEFHEIVSRFTLAERAKGFLMAKGFEIDAENDIEQNR